MRIAVASDGLDVSMHGGRCASYMCYTVQCGVIAECQNFPNPCLPPKATAQLLRDLDIDLFVVHRLDEPLRTAIEDAGVEVIAGAHGSARTAVNDFLSDMLFPEGTDAWDD